jgi:hypothetical protein
MVDEVASVLLMGMTIAAYPLAAASDVPVGGSPPAVSAPDSLPAHPVPSESSLARLSHQVDDRRVRVWLGEQRYEIQRVHLSSAGVVFDPADALVAGSASQRDQSPLSPIAWQQVDRIQSCHPHGLLGMVLGTFVGLILAGKFASNAGSDPGPGIVVVFVIPPAVAIVGGLVGHSIKTWETVWQRERD